MTEAEARKARSIAYLKKHQIPYIEHLPLIETEAEAQLKSREEIARRAVCCLITIQHAYDRLQKREIANSQQYFLRYLQRWNLTDYLTSDEWQIFRGEAEQNMLMAFTWKYEAYWVLAWALGLVDELAYPANFCDADQAIAFVSPHQEYAAFLATTKRRSGAEILDQTDLIYRLHWACVEARLQAAEMPSGLNPDVVLERHMALNWLVGYDDDWDNVSTDT